MRIIVFTMAWWESPEHAQSQSIALNKWLSDVRYYYRPQHIFVASGTWSEPMHSPLPLLLPVINGGVTKDRPYDAVWWNYSSTALTAALSYVLTRRDWDLVVCHDTDVLVGAVDFDSLLREFLSRPETLLCADWHGRPSGGSPLVWKPYAAAKWINQRRRANLIEHNEGDPLPMLVEDEMGEIHKGQWWNPWPHLQTMRQDFGCSSEIPERDPLEKEWPFVRMPNPSIIAEYTATQTSRAKPVANG